MPDYDEMPALPSNDDMRLVLDMCVNIPEAERDLTVYYMTNKLSEDVFKHMGALDDHRVFDADGDVTPFAPQLVFEFNRLLKNAIDDNGAPVFPPFGAPEEETVEPLALKTLLIRTQFGPMAAFAAYINTFVRPACVRLNPGAPFPWHRAVVPHAGPPNVTITQPRMSSQGESDRIQNGEIQDEDVWSTYISNPRGDICKLIDYAEDPANNFNASEVADILLVSGKPAIGGDAAIPAHPQIRKALFSKFAVIADLGNLQRDTPQFIKAFIAQFIKNHRSTAEQILRTIMPARHFTGSSNLIKILDGFLYGKAGTFRKWMHLLVGYDAIGPIPVRSWNDTHAFVRHVGMFLMHYNRGDLTDAHMDALLNGAAGSIRALQNMSPLTVNGPYYAVQMIISCVVAHLDARLPWAVGNSPIEPLITMNLSFS